MRRPLFWMLLVSSWLMLVLVAAGNIVVLNDAAEAVLPWGTEAKTRFERFQLANAARILEVHGPEALDAFVAELPEGERLQVVRGTSSGNAASGSDDGISRTVHTGLQAYTLIYRSSGTLIFPPVPSELGAIPLQLLAVCFIAVSLFSIVIARYLSKPIEQLRAGLALVAEGNLGVRLSEQMAGRRDELADLASDFDRMAERLQQLLTSRNRLLHDVSHELRSPLARVMLAVDLARQDPARSHSSLDRIEYEARQLSQMVGELLALSRAEFTAATSETYFAVGELVAAVTADAKYEAQAKGVEVRSEPEALSPECAGAVINGSPELFRKGIDNVLRNAVKFSKPGQCVRVCLSSLTADRIRIEVSDEGPGVADGALERIFEPFIRLEDEPQNTGFGLGLAIARSAAHAHKGTVWAANRPGGGLTVIFELPAHASAAL